MMSETTSSDSFHDAIAHLGSFIYVHKDPYAGRTYRATRFLPSGTVLFDVPTPYSYNLYKRFRNEVCAECWRYEGGRKGFLTRRDDHGYCYERGNEHERGGMASSAITTSIIPTADCGGPEVVSVEPSPSPSRPPSISENGPLGQSASSSRSGSSAPQHNHRKKGKKEKRVQGAGATSAGLWFCDMICQASWIDREGQDAVWALRVIEGARRGKGDSVSSRAGDETSKASQEAELKIGTEDAVVVERAWEEVREREGKGGWKEVRKWGSIQLDDYETDMARYICLALVRLRRERRRRRPTTSEALWDWSSEQQEGSWRLRGDWPSFSALQNNELQQLRALPTLITHQIRIYQALKGRFFAALVPGRALRDGQNYNSSYQVPTQSQAQAQALAHEREQKRDQEQDQEQKQEIRGESDKHASGGGYIWQEQGRGQEQEQEQEDGTIDLREELTVDNVRIALGVDPGNSFGIWEVPVMEESECLGFGVYPLPSLFNHSEYTTNVIVHGTITLSLLDVKCLYGVVNAQCSVLGVDMHMLNDRSQLCPVRC